MRTRSIRRGSMTISFAPSRSRFFMAAAASKLTDEVAERIVALTLAIRRARPRTGRAG